MLTNMHSEYDDYEPFQPLTEKEEEDLRQQADWAFRAHMDAKMIRNPSVSQAMRVKYAERICTLYCCDFVTYCEENFLFLHKFGRPASLNDFHLFSQFTYADRVQYELACDLGFRRNVFSVIQMIFEAKLIEGCQHDIVFNVHRDLMRMFSTQSPPETEYNESARRAAFEDPFDCNAVPVLEQGPVSQERFEISRPDPTIFVKSAYESMPAEDVPQCIDEVDVKTVLYDRRRTDAEIQYHAEEPILAESVLAPLLREQTYECVIYAPRRSGMTTFNRKNMVYESRWVSCFQERPKMILTNDPHLLSRGRFSLVILPSKETFRQRMVEAGRMEEIDQEYERVLECSRTADVVLNDDRYMTDAMNAWLIRRSRRHRRM